MAYDRSDPNEKYPIPGNRNLQFIKNTITKPNIIAGEYSYYDALNGESFEDQVFYQYEVISPEVIQELLDIKWWDHDIESINPYIEAIVSGDLNTLKMKQHR